MCIKSCFSLWWQFRQYGLPKTQHDVRLCWRQFADRNRSVCKEGCLCFLAQLHIVLVLLLFLCFLNQWFACRTATDATVVELMLCIVAISFDEWCLTVHNAGSVWLDFALLSENIVAHKQYSNWRQRLAWQHCNLSTFLQSKSLMPEFWWSCKRLILQVSDLETQLIKF